MSAIEEIIERLSLSHHPEGGWYRETWAGPLVNGRASATAILFLLEAKHKSAWHRVDADEIWLYHSGAPLSLAYGRDRAKVELLGPDAGAGHVPQVWVPKGDWQEARSSGEYSLVSCIVSPGFRWGGFEAAKPGFDLPR